MQEQSTSTEQAANAISLPDAKHVCSWCPTCAAPLESSRCKLVCRRCGYYMSCADYY